VAREVETLSALVFVAAIYSIAGEVGGKNLNAPADA
jgi:hypothetical protein